MRNYVPGNSSCTHGAAHYAVAPQHVPWSAGNRTGHPKQIMQCYKYHRAGTMDRALTEAVVHFTYHTHRLTHKCPKQPYKGPLYFRGQPRAYNTLTEAF